MRLGPNQDKQKKEKNFKNAYVVLGPQGGWADELVIQNQSLACRPLWTLQGDFYKENRMCVLSCSVVSL